MARDSMVLGDLGSGTEIVFDVQEYVENPNFRTISGPFDQHIRGGYSYPRKYGITQIQAEILLKINGSASNDALDILFGEWKSAVYHKLQTQGSGGSGAAPISPFGLTNGLTKFWPMEDYFYEVVLAENGIIERKRDMYSVIVGLTLLAPKGLKVFSATQSGTFANGSTLTIVSPANPDVYVDISTTIGVAVNLNGLSITPTATGVMTLDCTRSKAWRGNVSAQGEVSGLFPDFKIGANAIALSGVANVLIYYRRSML